MNLTTGKIFSPKRFRSVIMITALFIGAISVSAYSKSYSFHMSTAIIGKTKFNLANKSTNTKVTAQTYIKGTNQIYATKDPYDIRLYKNSGTYYTVSAKADGKTKLIGFGKIKTGQYTLNLTNQGSRYHDVIGNGTINQ